MTLPLRTHILIAGLIWSALLFAAPPAVYAGVILQHPTYMGLSSGLVGFWTFDGADTPINNSGIKTALDRSGNNYHAKSGSAAVSPANGIGKIGQALDFDGTADTMLASAPSLGNLTTMTMSAWIYPRSFGNLSLGAVLERVSGAFDIAYGVNNSAYTNSVDLFINCDGASDLDVAAPNNSIKVNQWQLITVTWTGGCALSSVTHFIDGSPVAQNGASQAGAGNPINNSGEAFEISSDNSDTFYFDGRIDDVRLYNRALSADEVKRLYKIGNTFRVNTTRKDTLTNGLVGHWTMDGGDTSLNGSGLRTVIDRSGNGNKAVSATAAAAPAVTIGWIGQALTFDGSSDELLLGDVNAVDGKSQLVISVWINQRSTTASLGIVSKYVADGMNFQTSDAGQSGGNDIALGLGGGVYGYTTANAHTANQWEHWVVVFDGSQAGDAGRLKIYLNGVSQALTFVGTIPATTPSDAHDLYIGDVADGSGFFDGAIDDLRIYNRALTPDEVKRLYKMGNTLRVNTTRKDTLTNGLVGYWTFDGKDMATNNIGSTTAFDRSGQGNNGTLTNGPTKTIGKIGQALEFDGVDDEVNVGTPASLNFGASESFSLSVWEKPRTVTPRRNLIHKVANTQDYILLENDGAAPTFGIGSGVGTSDIGSSVDITADTWNHIVGVRDTAADTLTIYVNGVNRGSVNDVTTSNDWASSGDWRIGGSELPQFISFFDGLIDEFRLYNRVLSPDEIKRLYNMGR